MKTVKKIFGEIPQIPPPARVTISNYVDGKHKHFSCFTVYADSSDVSSTISVALEEKFGVAEKRRRS